MIRLDLSDPCLIENAKAITFLRSLGLYTDAELQELYDDQLERDKKETK